MASLLGCQGGSERPSGAPAGSADTGAVGVVWTGLPVLACRSCLPVLLAGACLPVLLAGPACRSCLPGARAPTRSRLAVKDRASASAARRPSAVLDCEPLAIG